MAKANVKYPSVQWRSLVVLFFVTPLARSLATSGIRQRRSHYPPTTASQWIAELQRCRTPDETIQRICKQIPKHQGTPDLYSLILVRLSRQLLLEMGNGSYLANIDVEGIQQTMLNLLSEHPSSHDDSTEEWLFDCVEATKALAIIARSLDNQNIDSELQGVPLREFWRNRFSDCNTTLNTTVLAPPAMTGLRWAMDTFGTLGKNSPGDYKMPEGFQTAYDLLAIPFAIIPNSLSPKANDVSIWGLHAEVDFKADTIQTSSTQRSVTERRWTAWQGDFGVAPFTYSGKSMPRNDWTPSVLEIRNHLHETTQQYYDGCLLNFYPNGESAMRYHRDPDQGTLWDNDTAVVSIGSPRPFSFRHGQEIHNFVVFHGDVTHMFADCQVRFEHTVKKAGISDSPRISLVFKRSFTR